MDYSPPKRGLSNLNRSDTVLWMGIEKRTRRVVVIAASAGGIDALVQVLSRLPSDLPAAVLIVQHLRSTPQTRLPEYLGIHSPLQVCLANDGMPMDEGVAYVAVPGQHLRVNNERLILGMESPVNYVRPSADVLFSSAAHTFGRGVIGVVLSGTGRDGASGCREIKENGGLTIAQDEQTSFCFAMPKAAIDTGVIDYVLPLSEIAGKIVALVRKNTDEP